MTALPDLELSVRIGSLDPQTADSVQRRAAAARWQGLLPQATLDLARAAHWLAVGHPDDLLGPEMIDLLSLDEIPDAALAHLGAVLDQACPRPAVPDTDAQGNPLPDRRALGRRISLAVGLVSHAELTAHGRAVRRTR